LQRPTPQNSSRPPAEQWSDRYAIRTESTTDYSSFLLQAQSSGGHVIGFANAGSELISCLKQAQEFGLDRGNRRMVALVGYITDVVGMGLPTAKGLSLTETFYGTSTTERVAS